MVAPDAQLAVERYTAERRERVLLALRNGNSRKTAARYGGINKTILTIWLNDYPEFAEEVEAAEALAEMRRIQVIEKAAQSGKNWTAAAWLLERSNPQDWGRIDRVDLVVRMQQAEALAEELRAEGIEISAQQIMSEVEQLSKRADPQRALPPPSSMAS